MNLVIPGMDRSDFEINVGNEVLRVALEKEKKYEEKDKIVKFIRREFYYHSFKHSLILLESVQVGKIDATYEKSILEIIITKPETAQLKPVKQIHVK